jgi:hypothetical protein
VQRPQGPLHGQASRLLAQEKQGHLGSYIPNSFRSALLENKTKLKKPKTNLPPSHGRPPRQPGMKGVGRRGGRWGLKEESNMEGVMPYANVSQWRWILRSYVWTWWSGSLRHGITESISPPPSRLALAVSTKSTSRLGLLSGQRVCLFPCVREQKEGGKN